MELFADDIAAFMHVIGLERAHVMACRSAPRRACGSQQISRTGQVAVAAQRLAQDDPFLKVVVEGWRSMAKGLDSVTEMVIQGIFPWCLTPELYATKPDYIDQLAAFVRSRPQQPFDAFLRQSGAVIAHDAMDQLSRIEAPTQITFGRHDLVCSPRFADTMKNGVKGSELLVFETCAHAPIYESVAEFNEKTLGFLDRHSG